MAHSSSHSWATALLPLPAAPAGPASAVTGSTLQLKGQSGPSGVSQGPEGFWLGCPSAFGPGRCPAAAGAIATCTASRDSWVGLRATLPPATLAPPCLELFPCGLCWSAGDSLCDFQMQPSFPVVLVPWKGLEAGSQGDPPGPVLGSQAGLGMGTDPASLPWGAVVRDWLLSRPGSSVLRCRSRVSWGLWVLPAERPGVAPVRLGPRGEGASRLLLPLEARWAGGL